MREQLTGGATPAEAAAALCDHCLAPTLYSDGGSPPARQPPAAALASELAACTRQKPVEGDVGSAAAGDGAAAAAATDGTVNRAFAGAHAADAVVPCIFLSVPCNSGLKVPSVWDVSSSLCRSLAAAKRHTASKITIRQMICNRPDCSMRCAESRIQPPDQVATSASGLEANIRVAKQSVDTAAAAAAAKGSAGGGATGSQDQDTPAGIAAANGHAAPTDVDPQARQLASLLLRSP